MGRSEVNMDILWRPACGRVWAYGCSDQTVDDDVSLAARIFGDEAVHEVQELDTPATPVMTGLDQTGGDLQRGEDRKSTRLNSSHLGISYAVFCLKKKKKK